jgi:hypothetical protein
MHIVDTLTRMRLVASGLSHTMVVFRTNAARKMHVLKGDAPLIVRRHVAVHLDETAVAMLRRPVDKNRPDFTLMKQLHDSAIMQCPMSGMPTFDPLKLSEGERAVLWRAYCGIAASIDESSQTPELLATLEELRATFAARAAPTVVV